MHRLFLVEGGKSVFEVISSDFNIHILLATVDFCNCYQKELKKKGIKPEIVEADTLATAGTFESNSAALAIVEMKENKPIHFVGGEFVLVLDDVKDPGNLGTIIRIADWYGVNNIVCSETSADCYNPKVIAASMGSFTRVNIYYTILQQYLKENRQCAVYGATLSGKTIYKERFNKEGFLLMGNESKGISSELLNFVTEEISIPAFGKAESLNVAVATAVILDNIKRSE